MGNIASPGGMVKPRHVAEIRMQREVVGEAAGEPRPLTARVDGRSASSLPWESFRVGAGEGLVWDHRPVPISPFRLPTAGPNAPLLKRVVRHPYGMEPEKPVRAKVFDTSRPDRTVASPEPVRMVFRASRDARNLPAPLPIDHAPADRPRPFAKRRAAEEESR